MWNRLEIPAREAFAYKKSTKAIYENSLILCFPILRAAHGKIASCQAGKRDPSSPIACPSTRNQAVARRDGELRL